MRLFHRFAKTLASPPDHVPPPGPANKIEGIFETRVGDIADTHYSCSRPPPPRNGHHTKPMTWGKPRWGPTREEMLARGWCGVWSRRIGPIHYLRTCSTRRTYIIADGMEDTPGGRTPNRSSSTAAPASGVMWEDPTCLGGAYFPWMWAPGPATRGAGPSRGEDADWGVGRAT